MFSHKQKVGFLMMQLNSFLGKHPVQFSMNQLEKVTGYKPAKSTCEFCLKYESCLENCILLLLILSLFSPTALFGLRLYVPVNNFSVMSGRFPGLNQY